MLDRLTFLLKSEPVAVRTVLGLIISVLASKGLNLDVDQLLGVVTVVLSVAVVLARRKVTPVDPEVVASKLNEALRGERGTA